MFRVWKICSRAFFASLGPRAKCSSSCVLPQFLSENRFTLFRNCSICSLVAISFFLTARVMGQENEQPKWTRAQSFSGAYLAGRIAGAGNDIQAALDYYNQALAFSPDNYLVAQDLLLLFLSSNQFTQAVTLSQSLKDDVEIERYSRLTLAADAFNKHDFAAVPQLLELSDPDVMDTLIINLLGAWSLFGQGEVSGAIKKLENMEGPIWYDLFRYYHLALMYDLAGDKIQAQAAFEQLLDDEAGSAFAPDNYERILAAYATFKQANGDKQGALELLQKGSQALVGRNVFGAMHLDVSQDKALPAMVRDAREGAGEAIYSVGTAINRSGNEGHARLYLNISLGLRADHDATLFQLAELGVRIGQSQPSIELYQRLLPTSPYFRDGQWRLALILADNGRAEQATQLLHELIKSYPDDENLVIALSSIYMQDKNFLKVAEVVDQAIQSVAISQNQGWRLYFQRAIAYERLKKWENAEADFRKALEISPEQPQVLNYLGYSLIDRDMKLDEALEMVRLAADLRPKDGAIIDSLGWAYYKLGHYDIAIETLEEAVKLTPQDPTINDHLGDAYWQVGRKFEAVFQWNHALVGEPEPDDQIKIEDKLKHGLQNSMN